MTPPEGTDRSPAHRAARSATAPVREYFNQQFEMVKQEIRANAAAPGTEHAESAWARVAELESVLAEQAQHQARIMARVADDLDALTARIAELERVVRRFAPPDA